MTASASSLAMIALQVIFMKKKIVSLLFATSLAFGSWASQAAVATAHTWCASDAANDSYSFNTSQGHAVWLPGVVTSLVFDKKGGKFVENADGTADFTGALVVPGDANKGFTLNVKFTGLQTTAPEPPKKELDAKAYNEGKADMSKWYFYTGFTGTLTGVGDFAGSKLSLSRVGPAFQVGVGANGKNIQFGASGWFNFNIDAQPTNTKFVFYKIGEHGDFNINLNPCVVEKTTMCVYAAPGSIYNTSGGHALWLPSMQTNANASVDMIFLDSNPGILVEDGNTGTATLKGTLVRADNPNYSFYVDIFLSGFKTALLPGEKNKQELSSKAYSTGLVKPSTWYYYTDFTGTLTGLGYYAGLKASLFRRGPSPQFGVGANGKNLNYGASWWLNYSIITQSTSKSHYLYGDNGDINLDIRVCPPSILSKLK